MEEYQDALGHHCCLYKSFWHNWAIYQNHEENAVHFMWISVVPHQVGITTIVKVAWIRRFLSEMHTHTT